MPRVNLLGAYFFYCFGLARLSLPCLGEWLSYDDCAHDVDTGKLVDAAGEGIAAIE